MHPFSILTLYSHVIPVDAHVVVGRLPLLPHLPDAERVRRTRALGIDHAAEA